MSVATSWGISCFIAASGDITNPSGSIVHFEIFGRSALRLPVAHPSCTTRRDRKVDVLTRALYPNWPWVHEDVFFLHNLVRFDVYGEEHVAMVQFVQRIQRSRCKRGSADAQVPHLRDPGGLCLRPVGSRTRQARHGLLRCSGISLRSSLAHGFRRGDGLSSARVLSGRMAAA